MATDFRTRRKIKRFTKRVQKIKDKKHRYAYVMDQFQRGQLHASGGYRVQNPAQAKAIAFSMTYGRKKMRPKPVKPKSFLGRVWSRLTGKQKKARSQ